MILTLDAKSAATPEKYRGMDRFAAAGVLPISKRGSQVETKKHKLKFRSARSGAVIEPMLTSVVPGSRATRCRMAARADKAITEPALAAVRNGDIVSSRTTGHHVHQWLENIRTGA